MVLHNARVLILVKTYPVPSSTYDELVCTAGLLPDGNWVRIYPVPFRMLDEDEQYKKWDWIQLNLEARGKKDHRPESHCPLRRNEETIQIIGNVGVGKDHLWRDRRKMVENSQNGIHRNLGDMISAAKANRLSLGVLKPKEVLEVVIKVDPFNAWTEADQQQMLELTTPDERQKLNRVKPLPFRFYYRIQTFDNREATMMVEDWEIGALYWNCLRDTGDPTQACEKVKEKLLKLAERDLHLFLGTTYRNHHRAPNPFVIVGLFYPPFLQQPEFDFPFS